MQLKKRVEQQHQKNKSKLTVMNVELQKKINNNGSPEHITKNLLSNRTSRSAACYSDLGTPAFCVPQQLIHKTVFFITIVNDLTILNRAENMEQLILDILIKTIIRRERFKTRIRGGT